MQVETATNDASVLGAEVARIAFFLKSVLGAHPLFLEFLAQVTIAPPHPSTYHHRPTAPQHLSPLPCSIPSLSRPPQQIVLPFS